jgi:hypothetical protein
MENLMTSVTQLFVVAAALAATLGRISIWVPRRLLIEGAALTIATLFLPLAYASLVELLSKPKPIDLEWWLSDAAEARGRGRAPGREPGHLPVATAA